MKKWIIFGLVAVIAVGRIFITPRLTNIPNMELEYETWAHLFCGGLIAISWYVNGMFSEIKGAGLDKQATQYGRLGWALAFWELGWFMVQKMNAGS